jgi:hypothetical protein
LERRALFKLRKPEREIARLKLENNELLDKVKLGQEVINKINIKRKNA